MATLSTTVRRVVSTLADHSLPASAETANPRRCPFCDGSATAAFTAADRNRECSTERFSYRRCTRCGTFSLVDVPTDMSRFYPSAYYEFPPRSSLDALAVTEAHKVAMIRE